jgi:hypothetical protein
MVRQNGRVRVFKRMLMALNFWPAFWFSLSKLVTLLSSILKALGSKLCQRVEYCQWVLRCFSSVFPGALRDSHINSATVGSFHIHFNSLLSFLQYFDALLMVKAIYYKLEGRGFETRWGERIFSIYLIFSAVLDPGVYSVCNKNEYQKKTMFLLSIARPVRKTGKLTAICEPIVYTMCDLQYLTPIGLHGLLRI